MKIACTRNIVKNYWDYYLLKWGFKDRVRLSLHTIPDNYPLDLDRKVLSDDRDFLKTLFMLIKRSRLEYHKLTGKFIVHSADGNVKKELVGGITSIETFEKAVDVFDKIEDHDGDLFKVKIKGAKFLIRKKIPSDVYVLRENFLEDQYAFIYPYVSGADVVDIGANIGDTAVLFCRHGARRVYAYEPHPFFFDLAARNIDLNGFKNMVAMNMCGVGGKEFVFEMRDDSAFGPTGCFGLKDDGQGKKSEIKVIPFSKIIEGLGDDTVVKMDCEGFEFEAVLTCPAQMLKKVAAMAIEFHRDPAPIVGHLKSAGFDVDIKSEVVSKYDRCGILFAKRR